MRNVGSVSKENRHPRPRTEAVGIVPEAVMQPTATHVEALTGNFLDGEFDPPPSPPVANARGIPAAGDTPTSARGRRSINLPLRRTQQLEPTKRTIVIDGESIPYTLQRSKRRKRTVQLQSSPETGFRLLVPHTMSVGDIEEFLLEHSGWIANNRPDPDQATPEPRWVDGGTVMFRGQDVALKVLEHASNETDNGPPPSVVKSLTGDEVSVNIPPGMDEDDKSRFIRQLLLNWYRQEAGDHFRTRVTVYANVMGVKPRHIKLSNARKRWGSCSEKRSINLNWRLIMLDDRVIDYVIVHELAHIVELNHSARFWRVVEGVVPDYREMRRQLMTYSPSSLG